MTSRAEYADELVHRTARIVGAVHDDGPDELLRQIDLALALEQPEGVDPVVALVTVLAAQVDPDASSKRRLGWVEAFADRAQPPPVGGDRMADLVDTVTAGHAPLDEIPARLRHLPVQRLTDAGLPAEEIARRLGCHERTVVRHRAAQATEQRGAA